MLRVRCSELERRNTELMQELRTVGLRSQGRAMRMVHSARLSLLAGALMLRAPVT